MATRVLRLTESAWAAETSVLGWDPPASDRGACGTNERFDVFVWRGFRSAESEAIAEIPETPWDDRANYLVIDPWGPYGGAHLAGTIAHELNHAMQAAHDWNELPAAFEMTSEFIEDQIDDSGNAYMEHLADFQQRPAWSVLHDDQYETWFMYGASLYFFYLKDAVFQGDARFAADIWRRARSRAGHNVPDFIDALNAVLGARGTTFAESLSGFSRWRWYTGARDDGRHFEEGASFPPTADVHIDAVVEPPCELRIDPGIEIFGMSYVTVHAPIDGVRVNVQITGDDRIRYVVHAVPGIRPGSDGDVVTPNQPLEFGALEQRTIVITALPRTPDDHELGRLRNARMPWVLKLTPRSP